MSDEYMPTVEVKMLIRKPVSEVFEAMIDPAITTQFWFTKSSGRLEEGKTILWEWEMYGAKAEVLVKEIVPNKSIVLLWGEPSTRVVFSYEPTGDDSTYVTIINDGFKAEGKDLIEIIKDSTGGFTTVLDGMKAYLEHGIHLNLVSDKYPQYHI